MRHHHRAHGKAIFAGEIQIALIMGRAAENGPGAIIHQHEISHIDGKIRPFIKRMPGHKAGIETFFLRRFQGFLRGAGALTFFDEGHEIGIGFRQLQSQRMIHGHSTETGPENGIGAGGIHLQPILKTLDFKAELQTFRTADPIFLHGPHFFGPAFQRFQIIEQFIGKFGDFQKPLR